MAGGSVLASVDRATRHRRWVQATRPWSPAARTRSRALARQIRARVAPCDIPRCAAISMPLAPLAAMSNAARSTVESVARASRSS